MLREYITTFYSSYLITSLIIFPMFLLVYFFDKLGTSKKIILTSHKILTLSTILIPFLMIFTILFTGFKIKSNVPDYDININTQISMLYSTITLFFYIVVDIITVLSFTGILIFLFKLYFQNKYLLKLQNNSEKTNYDNFDIFTSNYINKPFSVGLLRKKIFIPKNITGYDRNIVIDHEKQHFLLHHPLWFYIEIILIYIFWFNPLSYLLHKKGNELREIECDQKLISKVDKKIYSTLLLNLANSVNYKRIMFAENFIKKSTLRKRIEFIFDTNKKRYLKTFSILFIILLCITIGTSIWFSYLVSNKSFENKALYSIKTKYNFVISNRITNKTDINKVPNNTIHALIIHQDTNYFDHKGISVKHIFGALLSNIKSFITTGKFLKRGGSTITQQLAKTFIDEKPRTIKMKIKQLLYSRIIENNFDKNKILEMYLNTMYFGNSFYGLADASIGYFKHSYAHLSLKESAMLIPFIDLPEKYNMLKAPVIAQKRQKQLLEKIRNLEEGL